MPGKDVSDADGGDNDQPVGGQWLRKSLDPWPGPYSPPDDRFLL